MAEEKNTPETTDLGMDDMSALSFVLQQVKGIGLVSSNRLDTTLDDDTQAA
jgi:hypothetical protein